jgi:hypothetical protein
MATKKKPLMDDHDDAHFSGNPALRKRSTKKRVSKKAAPPFKGHNYGSSPPWRDAKHIGTKNTRKRVAGK